jgi:iduronate 2-sulfatase
MVIKAPINTPCLFIAVDDSRPEVGVYGVTAVKTPNIDALSREGIRFTRAYTQMATCSPSRTSLLTGLRPDTTGVKDLTTHFRSVVPNVLTLPQWFKQNGYETQGICKIFPACLDDSASWSRPFKDGYGPAAPKAADGRTMAFAAFDRPDRDFGDYKCAEHAIDSINELRDAPFFIAVGFRKPHLPIIAPPEYFQLYNKASIPEAANPSRASAAPSFAFGDMQEFRNYSPVPEAGPFEESLRRDLKHGYYAATSFVDAQIGRVLEELERAGLSDNTLVVLWGDHGYHLGEQVPSGWIGFRAALIHR